MPPWMMELLIAGGGLGLMAGGLKAWWTDWRDARKERERQRQATIDKLEAQNEALRGKVESLLMDAFARERETNALRAERLAMDKQFAALATAMTAALERAESNAKLRGGM